MKEFQAQKINIDNDLSQVNINWGDNHQSFLPITRLRGYCPCAACQGYSSPKRFIKNRTHGIDKIEMVGRYAICFHFSDGHRTGIFRWEQLRKLDPLEEERWGLPEDNCRSEK